MTTQRTTTNDASRAPAAALPADRAPGRPETPGPPSGAGRGPDSAGPPPGKGPKRFRRPDGVEVSEEELAMAEEGGAEWAVGLRYGFRAPGLPEGVDPEEAAARAREELPEPTGTHEGLDALDVARISRILVRAFGMRGLAVDEATEVILRDGWRRA